MLGIITPDVTTTLGYIDGEAVRSLGLITPDVVDTLGDFPPTQIIPLGEAPRMLFGIPLSTWLTVVGTSGVGAGAAGWLATRSAKGWMIGSIGGMVGSAAGIAVSAWLTKRSLEKMSVASVQIPQTAVPQYQAAA
jgi:hypothetical protein